MLRIVRATLTATFAALAACTETASFDPLPVSATVSLAAGEYVILNDAAAAGAVAFPQAGAAGAEYLVVSQFATPFADLSSNTRLGGQARLTAAAADAPLEALLRAPPSVADRFHAMLREREAAAAREAYRFRGSLVQAPRVSSPPVVYLSQRTFKVCGTLSCSNLVNVPATALWVGTHVAIFVDDAAPANGLTQSDLAAFAAEFDTIMHPLSQQAFGAESDTDGNGVVIVLLTPRVNALVGRPDCNNAYVTGFFFGLDLAPGYAQQYNNGEVFYGMVPDPAGTVSCTRSVSEVRAVLPKTFMHEFQHMISFSQHVLARPGLPEVLWVNEGLSHLAEELMALHYDSLGNQQKKTQYLIDDVYNAYIYLRDPAPVAVITEDTPGTLEGRGAEWLLMRYIADRFGLAATRALVQTQLTGAANVEAAVGRDFRTLLGEWALAIWVDDLPNFSAPTALKYSTWNFRTTFASLNQQAPQDFDRPFPLIPSTGVGGDAEIVGTVASGSGHYLLVGQPANGAAFSLTFRPATGGSLAANRGGQFAIVRIR